MKSPLRRSTSVREIYMEETIIKGNHTMGGLAATAEDAETTINMLPDAAVASLQNAKSCQTPGTPKLADYLRTPSLMKGARQWTLAHEQDRTAKYALMCQRAIRMKRFRLRLGVLKLAVEQTRAALVVQRQWRMKVFRRRMCRYRRAATVIQCWYRRARVERERRRQAAVAEQIALERIRLVVRVRAAKRVQRWYREIRARRAEQKRRLLVGVVSVQAQWRMILAKRQRNVKLNAIRAIQGWFRVRRAQRMLCELRCARAAVNIQKQWKMICARRAYQSKVIFLII